MKAAPPKLKAELKLHKIGIPIRPLINNRTAPAYKLAKHLTRILDQYITLHNRYTVTNPINLTNDVTNLKIHENHRLITFDIKDLCVNIPITEILNISKQNYYRPLLLTQQILSLLKAVPTQNYFSFQQKSINLNRASPWDHRYSVKLPKYSCNTMRLRILSIS
jgi:hypothetical protein